MHLLPPSVVIPVDVMSRLTGMCTCVTLGRKQVEGPAASFFYCCFPQSPFINKSVMLQTKSRPSLFFPNGYSLIPCFDAIQSGLLKESLHELLHT